MLNCSSAGRSEQNAQLLLSRKITVTQQVDQNKILNCYSTEDQTVTQQADQNKMLNCYSTGRSEQNGHMSALGTLQSSINKPVGTKPASSHPDLDFAQKTNLYAWYLNHTRHTMTMKIAKSVFRHNTLAHSY